VFTAAEQPLRAEDVCRAFGFGVAANPTESLRAELKRVVNRGVLTENHSGLFTLTPGTVDPTDAVA
jgi:hypothetical protein